jgi:hypothetical protein
MSAIAREPGHTSSRPYTLRAQSNRPVPSRAGSSPANGDGPGQTPARPLTRQPHRASARSPSRGTGPGGTGTAAPSPASPSPAVTSAAGAARDGDPAQRLATLTVDTPVAAAIWRGLPPAASSPAIRSTASGVSFEGPSARRAGTSPATPPAASA